MLYMKEMRANVVAECTLKESAAINQILGRRVGTSTEQARGAAAVGASCPSAAAGDMSGGITCIAKLLLGIPGVGMPRIRPCGGSPGREL